jgi:Rrf2 family iron-sulfur cluster assembly transcriptional regulator
MAILAAQVPKDYADARVIAERIGAPPNYLAKLLGQMAKAGLVEARKGAGGCFRLARPASELCLYEILEPVEQLVSENDCILGRDNCDGSAPCALHSRWAGIRREMIDFLKTTRLDTLAGDRSQ